MLVTFSDRSTVEQKLKEKIKLICFAVHFLNFLFSLYGYFACMYIGVSLAFLVPTKTRKGIRSLETGVANDYEPSCGCQESNPGPLGASLYPCYIF